MIISFSIIVRENGRRRPTKPGVFIISQFPTGFNSDKEAFFFQREEIEHSFKAVLRQEGKFDIMSLRDRRRLL